MTPAGRWLHLWRLGPFKTGMDPFNDPRFIEASQRHDKLSAAFVQRVPASADERTVPIESLLGILTDMDRMPEVAKNCPNIDF